MTKVRRELPPKKQRKKKRRILYIKLLRLDTGNVISTNSPPPPSSQEREPYETAGVTSTPFVFWGRSYGSTTSTTFTVDFAYTSDQ